MKPQPRPLKEVRSSDPAGSLRNRSSLRSGASGTGSRGQIDHLRRSRAYQHRNATPTPTRHLRRHSCPAESSESVSVRMDGSPAKSCSALSLSVTH